MGQPIRTVIIHQSSLFGECLACVLSDGETIEAVELDHTAQDWSKGNPPAQLWFILEEHFKLSTDLSSHPEFC